MVLRVLRDVFRCAPEELTVTVMVEHEDWDDEDDLWLPVDDCAALVEALRQDRPGA